MKRIKKERWTNYVERKEHIIMIDNKIISMIEEKINKAKYSN